jgi:hypothetical protein
MPFLESEGEETAGGVLDLHIGPADDSAACMDASEFDRRAGEVEPDAAELGGVAIGCDDYISAGYGSLEEAEADKRLVGVAIAIVIPDGCSEVKAGSVIGPLAALYGSRGIDGDGKREDSGHVAAYRCDKDETTMGIDGLDDVV